MKRRLFKGLFALSLLLFLAVVGAWVISNRVHLHSIGIAIGWRTYHDDSRPVVGIYAHDWGDGEDEVWPAEFRLGGRVVGDVPPLVNHRPIGLLGFQIIAWRAMPRDWYFVLGLPFWFLALASGYASYRLWPRRMADSSSTLCASCGYDLRATPQRCPECGAVAAEPTA